MVTTVLLIDSNIPFMVSLKNALEETGDFHVHMAAHPDAAEELLRQETPQIAVLAFDVGGVDAMILIRMLRKIDPNLAIIITPGDDIQFERAQFMDVQAVLAKPYNARDLLPRLRSALRRPAEYNYDDTAAPEPELGPPAEQAPAQPLEMDPVEGAYAGEADELDLDHLEIPPPFGEEDPFADAEEYVEEYAGEDLDEDDIPYDDPDGTRILDMGDGDPRDFAPHDDDDDDSDTDTLLEWARPDPTGTQGEAEGLSADTWRIQPRKRDTRPLERRQDEPAGTASDDTLQDREYDDMQDFFGTSVAEESEGFDDVLDAVAHSDADDRTASDREFHELVESMRRDEPARPRRSRLEDLLASIATESGDDIDIEDEEKFNRVLDAIHQDRVSAAQDEYADDETDDDTTIGDVIDGLFDPSFEGVLAALSGEEMGEVTIEEPTYANRVYDTDEDEVGEEGEDYAPEEAGRAVSEPAQQRPPEPGERAAGAPGESRDDERPVISEPVARREDSTKYPATTALVAVSGEDDALSLDELLSQIEQQLPSVRPDRPRLKPLPSWRRAGYLEGASALARLFDNIESAQEDVAREVFSDDERLHDAVRHTPEAKSAPEPAPDRVGLDDVVVDEDTGELLSMEELFARADLPPEAVMEEIARDRAQHAPAEPGEAADRDATAEEIADSGPSDDEIAEMFYEGVRMESVFWAHDIPEPPPDLPEPVPAFDVPLDELDLLEVPPDEDHLVPMPVDEATQRIEAASAEEEEAAAKAEDAATIARIAVQLTQYSLESSAQATMLSREGDVLASAGDVDEDTIADLFEAVNHAWTRSTIASTSLIRMVELPDGGEFMVYSTRLTDDMTLSMAFHTNTSLRLIRRQARRVSESLDLIPDAVEYEDDEEPPAARTLPNRPTSAAPPPGLRESVAEQDAGELPPRPAHDDEPYTAYTALWLPYDPGRELDGALAESLVDWIQEVAGESAWDLLDLHVHPDYVALTLSAPQKLSPDSVVTHLMHTTATAAAEVYHDLAEGGPLWTDGYYVVTPPRELTDREISRIVTMQRNAQLER